MSKLNNLSFTFEYALLDHALNELKKLHPNKSSSPVNDILSMIYYTFKLIKEKKDIVTLFIHHNFNNSLSSSRFPTALKYSDTKPVLETIQN